MAAASKPKRPADYEPKAPSGTITGEAKRNDWQTPERLLAGPRAYAGGDILLDPATAPDNPTRARKFCAPSPVKRWKLRAANGGAWIARDGLAIDWAAEARGGLVFVNPPYGQKAGGVRWMDKIAAEARRGCVLAVLLGASRWEQPYFTGMLREASALCLVRGRVAFRNPDTGDEVPGIPYASIFIGFNVVPWRWRDAFEPLAGTATLQARGERSPCFELRAL